MSARSEALHELDARYRAFHSPIAGLPDAAYAEPWLGEWNLAHVLAHMTGWFMEMTAGFQRVGRGERPTPDGVDYSDEDDWNARFAASAKTGREALLAFDSAYLAYVAAAQALSEDLFGLDPEKGRPRIGSRLLQGAGIGHFEEHQPQLDAWLASRG